MGKSRLCGVWNRILFLSMRVLLFVSIISLFFSCKKAENRSCYKSSGEHASLIIALPDFNQLTLLKKLDYTLIQDSLNYLKVIGGKNLLNFIEFEEIEKGHIQISNKNKCNFLRDLSSSIMVEIHYKKIDNLRYEGSGKLTNRDTLNFTNFNFLIVDCSGSVYLNLKANTLKAEIAEGFGDFTLCGTADYANLIVRSNGYGHAENLQATTIAVINKSPGDLYINADNSTLTGYVAGSGNIYYKGIPSMKNVEEISSGRLIPY